MQPPVAALMVPAGAELLELEPALGLFAVLDLAGISDLTWMPLLPNSKVTVLTSLLWLNSAPGTAASNALAAPSAPFGYLMVVLSITSEVGWGTLVVKPS